MFGNILRLAHVRQEELKQLLLDIYGDQFQQREIDLARNYAAGFEKVRRDSHEVQELKLLQGDIERVLKHLERRDRDGSPVCVKSFRITLKTQIFPVRCPAGSSASIFVLMCMCMCMCMYR